jgi:hypothetical protein
MSASISCRLRSRLLAKLAVAALGTVVAAASFAAIELPTEKSALIALGVQHKTAWDLYKALQAQANGGQRLNPARLPDWTGVYSRSGVLFNWDQDQGRNRMPTAKLTPEYERRLITKLDNIEKGIEFDNLSNCAPPGHPRWMTEPFLRDFVVTPDQTYLINEMVNDIRRIYTDGRDHIPEADRYPLWNGDSIGFWDGGKLVIHTNSLRAGQYQRTQPEYTEQVETVEVWEKVDDKTLVAHIWVYDPPALVEPWYSKHTYVKLTNDDKSLRIHYWDCGENQNNTVIQTEDGSSQFRDFDFTEQDN